MGTILEVRDLHVVYTGNGDTVRAVNGINFSLQEGASLGVVGETGAGKTTVALSIMGLLPERTSRIESGEIVFDGQDLLKLKEKEMQAIRGVRVCQTCGCANDAENAFCSNCGQPMGRD